MTRAMDVLVLTRARCRRRYGNDMPEASIPSRFLEEIPAHLLEDMTRGIRPAGGAYGSRYGASRNSSGRSSTDEWSSRHYSYEDEDQRARSVSRTGPSSAGNRSQNGSPDNIAQFFSSRNPPGARPRLEVPVPTGGTGFRNGQRVRHPKYGEGVVFRREGDGDDAKITVQFAEFGVKKLVEKFAQLEKV